MAGLVYDEAFLFVEFLYSVYLGHHSRLQAFFLKAITQRCEVAYVYSHRHT